MACLGEPEKNEECESYATVHDRECDGCYDYNIDKDQYVVQVTPLVESYEMLVHAVPPPYLKHVEYMSQPP